MPHGARSLAGICISGTVPTDAFNVPYDKAAAIYANIEVGMPVVVYE